MRKHKKSVACISAALLSVSAFTVPAYAQVNNTEDAVQYVFRLVRSLAIPIAVIAVAAVAFTLFSGSEKEMEKIPARLKYIAFAIAGILLIGLIVNFGANLGRNSGGSTISWDPDGDNAIVDDTVPGAELDNLVGIVWSGEEESSSTDDTGSEDEEE